MAATEWAPAYDQNDPDAPAPVVVGRFSDPETTVRTLSQTFLPIAMNDSLLWLLDQAGIEMPARAVPMYPRTSGRGWPHC